MTSGNADNISYLVLASSHVTHLLTTLCRYDDVELKHAVSRCCEPTGFGVVGGANVRYDSIKHDVRMFGDRTKIVSETDKKCDFLIRRQRSTCAKNNTAIWFDQLTLPCLLHANNTLQHILKKSYFRSIERHLISVQDVCINCFRNFFWIWFYLRRIVSLHDNVYQIKFILNYL